MAYKKNVAIIGAGYVGLTLAIYMADRGSNVIVIENDKKKLKKLKQGKSPIYEVGLNTVFKKCFKSKKLTFSEGSDAYSDNWIIAISYFPGDVKKYIDVLKYIKTENNKPPTVMIRGTVPVGYTRKFLIPALKKIFKGNLDEKFYLTTAPERTLSGDALNELEDLPQLVGGTDVSVNRCSKVYNKVGIDCIELESLESGELAKTFTNFARLVQFNLSNYLGSLCINYQINDQAIFNALKEGYPRLNFLSEIGPGVGGFCLPKDSLVLHDAFKEINSAFPKKLSVYPEQQFYLNKNIINYHINIVKSFLKKSDNILAIGIAFKGKPQTDDTRDSTGLAIVKSLLKNKYKISVYDRTVSKIDQKKLKLITPHSLSKSKYSALLILNNDDNYKKYLKKNIFKFKKKIKIYDPWRIIVKTESLFIQDSFVTENFSNF